MKLIKQSEFTGRIPPLRPGRVFCMNGVALWHGRDGKWYVGEERDVRFAMNEPAVIERGYVTRFATRAAAVRRFNAIRPQPERPDSYGPQDQYE